MKFSFVVGVNEQHRVDFSFDHFIGNLEIKVDGQTAITDFRTFSLTLTKRYELMVGVNEKHHVAIEKKRKVFLAGVRPHQYRVFIDGQLVQTYEGWAFKSPQVLTVAAFFYSVAPILQPQRRNRDHETAS